MKKPHSIRSIFPAMNYRAYRLSFAAGSILLYVIIFFFLHYAHPFRGLPIVAIIPVIVIAWLYGARIGVIAGVLSLPFNVLMFTIIDINWIKNMLETGSGIAGTIGLIFIALIVGRLSDQGQRLRKELSARQIIEKELELHRESLEKMVHNKTGELREIQERFRAIAEHCPDAIIISDIKGIICYCNSATEKMFGYGHEEILGQSHSILLPQRLREAEVNQMRSHIGAEGLSKLSNPAQRALAVRKDGTEFPVEFPFFSWQIDDEIFFTAIMRDITERTRAEEQLKNAYDALQRSRNFFEDVFNMAGDGIFVADDLGLIVFANKALCDMLGYDLCELRGTPAADIIAEMPGLDTDMAIIHKMYYGDYSKYFEVSYLRKDGSSLPVEVKITNVQEGAQESPAVIVVVRDITERKRAENEVRHAHEYLEHVFEASPDAIIVTDAEGYIIMANESLYSIYGYHPQEIIGQHAAILTPEEETALQKGVELMEELFEKGSVRSFPSERIHKDGHRMQVESSVVLLKNPDGTPSGAISSNRDITDRKRLEEQLRQSQKMEAIGTLAGGIAHDFNNILAAIMGYTELSKDLAKEGSVLEKNLSRVLKAADRAKGLVHQILTFSRKTESDLKPLHLNFIVKEALKLLRASLPSTISILSYIDDTDDVVVGDATEIHQIVMNLCTNAAYAMQHSGGAIEVTLKPVDLDGHAALYYTGIEPGPYVQLSIKDAGTGIPANEIDRIFEPFFTTKGVGRGTGMGLSVVHGIVKSLRGDIKVYSEPDKGTVFHIVLPRAQAGKIDEHSTGREAPQGSESVLLVDDEAVLLDVGEQILGSLGYRVTAISSAVEALALFAKNPAAFDIVITDQTMPQLTGYELAQRLMEIRRDIPVILCTGYSDLVTAETALAGGIRAFVIKPLNRLALAEKIRWALGESAE